MLFARLSFLALRAHLLIHAQLKVYGSRRSWRNLIIGWFMGLFRTYCYNDFPATLFHAHMLNNTRNCGEGFSSLGLEGQ
jgi:hypothetical protein